MEYAKNYELVDPHQLEFYDRNPRINDDAVDAVANSILKHGFNKPLAVKNNVVYAGNTRLKAALKLGLKVVPIVHIDHLTDKQLMAYNIADNKTSEFADWDTLMLRENIIDLEQNGVDLGDTCFLDKELAIIKSNPVENIIEDHQNTKGEKQNVCPECGYEW